MATRIKQAMEPKNRETDRRRKGRGRLKGYTQSKPSAVMATMTTISAPRRRRIRRRKKGRRRRRAFPRDPYMYSSWGAGTCRSAGICTTISFGWRMILGRRPTTWWIALSTPITAASSLTRLGESRGRRWGEEEGREAARGGSDD